MDLESLPAETGGHERPDWPHAPPHRLESSGVYFVTARTLNRIEYFHSADRRSFVCESLFTLAFRYNWRLEAWAVLSNHYHLVALSPDSAESAHSLRRFLRHFHAETARHVNRLDGAQGRKVWHNYRETHLTYEKSYLARLNYTHNNAVHHGIVADAADYQWCSARSFEQTASPARIRTIKSFRFDEIALEDGDA